ncbi:hypothetical protein MHYP_G00115500 [Metynnis hypsauchen]
MGECRTSQLMSEYSAVFLASKEQHNWVNSALSEHFQDICTNKMANPLKSEVVRLYKTLLFLGREYPKGADYFRDRLRAAFTKNRDVKDPEEIRQLLSRGEYVVKELEALYYLRKYRAMKKRYYDAE